jgi:hypothetical protein
MDLTGRIAICFSGQIRTGIENSESLLKYIGHLRDTVDIFIHTWDIETMSTHATEHADIANVADIRRSVEKFEFNEIVKIYDPIDMRVDNFDLYQNIHYKRVIMREGYCHAQIPMFQSIWESNQLKRNYEYLSNSKYNLVMRLRFDIDFGEDRTLEQDMNYIGTKKDMLYVVDFGNKFPNAIEDVCWLGSSEVIDTTCDFAIERESKKNSTDWQSHHAEYLAANNIKIRPFKDNTIKIVRRNILNTQI